MNTKPKYDDAFDEYITTLTEIQKNKAIEKYGYFKNNHEFYGVVLEEVEEASEEIEIVKLKLGMLWNDIKKDSMFNDYVDDMEYRAKLCIQELIQVIACCKKFKGG